MASSSDTFASALFYALELLGKTNLTLNEEQWKSLKVVYQGYSVRKDEEPQEFPVFINLKKWTFST